MTDSSDVHGPDLMKLKNVYKARAAASAIVALSLLALLINQYWFKSPATPEVRFGSLTAKSSADVKLRFSLLETPRALPEIRFVDGDNREHAVAELGGKLILLNIWATWCVPCRREMPALDRLQAKIGRENLQILALSIDLDGLAKVKAFYKKYALTALGTHINASPNVLPKLGVMGIPTTLLLGVKGRELGRLVGPAEWDSPAMLGFLRQQIEQTQRTRGTQAN